MRITKTEDPTTTHTQTHGERVTQEKKTKIKKHHVQWKTRTELINSKRKQKKPNIKTLNITI